MSDMYFQRSTSCTFVPVIKWLDETGWSPLSSTCSAPLLSFWSLSERPWHLSWRTKKRGLWLKMVPGGPRSSTFCVQPPRRLWSSRRRVSLISTKVAISPVSSLSTLTKWTGAHFVTCRPSSGRIRLTQWKAKNQDCNKMTKSGAAQTADCWPDELRQNKEWARFLLPAEISFAKALRVAALDFRSLWFQKSKLSGSMEAKKGHNYWHFYNYSIIMN